MFWLRTCVFSFAIPGPCQPTRAFVQHASSNPLPPTLRIFSCQNLLNDVYDAARVPTSTQFNSYMRRVQEEKPATFNHLMTKLPFRMWTHHAYAQHTRIGDTVTSNNAESSISQIGEEVRLMQDLHRWSERQGRNVVPLRFGGNHVQGGCKGFAPKRFYLLYHHGLPSGVFGDMSVATAVEA